MAVVGAAAAVKSTLAELVCAACRLLQGTKSWIQCVSMDGYSFPNSYLVSQSATDHLGRPCSLKEIKGAPSPLDADALLRDLLLLRSSTSNTDAILLPAYSR